MCQTSLSGTRYQAKGLLCWKAEQDSPGPRQEKDCGREEAAGCRRAVRHILGDPNCCFPQPLSDEVPELLG